MVCIKDEQDTAFLPEQNTANGKTSWVPTHSHSEARLRGEPQKRKRKRRDPRVEWGEEDQVLDSGKDGDLVGVDWRILKGLGRGGQQRGRKGGTCRRKELSVQRWKWEIWASVCWGEEWVVPLGWSTGDETGKHLGGMIIKGRAARNGDNIEIDGSKCSLPLWHFHGNGTRWGLSALFTVMNTEVLRGRTVNESPCLQSLHSPARLLAWIVICRYSKKF